MSIKPFLDNDVNNPVIKNIKIMKTKLLFFSVLVISGLMFSNIGFAQQDCKSKSGDNKTCIMDELTPDQTKKVEAIKLESDRKITLYKADLKIKKAEYDKLMIAESPVKKDIDAKIDEMSVLKSNIQKENVNRRLSIRNELTPEQRVKFDAMQSKKGNGNDCHSGKSDTQMHKGCDKEGMQKGCEEQMHKNCDKSSVKK